MSHASHAVTPPPDSSKIRLEIIRASQKAGTMHWRLRNGSDAGIYVYNFFLLGPAYSVERGNGKLIFDTTPTKLEDGCAPNRVAPLLLLFVRSGGVIEGDFVDTKIASAGANAVSLKIAVGSEPNSVVEEEKRIYNKTGCGGSPYNAVVNWATFVESNVVHLGRVAQVPIR
jgi:hypothetical protein